MNLRLAWAMVPLLRILALASPLDSFKAEEMPDPITQRAYATLADLDGDGFLDMSSATRIRPMSPA